MNKYPNLFSPIKIGCLTLKNRIMSAPTSLAELSPEGHLTRENIAYYKLRAQGGAAIINLGDVVVQGATGKSHPKQIIMDDPDVLPSLVELVDAIKSHGAIASIELNHGGKECRRPFISGFPLGPVAETNYFGREIKEMSVEQIESIVEAFGASAATAKLAGFDMCTIHAGHGWLLSQFISPLSNKRKDEYGGSLENRMRFVFMVIERIRKLCGKDFPIEIRISGSELTGDGYGIEGGIEIAKMLDGKVDLIHVSVGTTADPETSVRVIPSMFLEHGCNVYLAAEIKKHVITPIATVGGISDPAQMEKIITSGKADIIALARALIADPYLPKKAKAGRDDEIRPCLRCYACLGGMYVTRTMKCSVNPIIGRELQSQFVIPNATPKKVLIAGGGPAGMRLLRQRKEDMMLLSVKKQIHLAVQ
jgi:2,4-dienoyl-CoA reductase-like NADH-dependent reductase (Old Yellow Enzyme family)